MQFWLNVRVCEETSGSTFSFNTTLGCKPLTDICVALASCLRCLAAFSCRFGVGAAFCGEFCSQIVLLLGGEVSPPRLVSRHLFCVFPLLYVVGFISIGNKFVHG